MHRLDQQLLIRLAMTFVLILGVITLSAVLSQAARLTDDVLEQGMSLSQFGLMLLSLTPKMAELVTPLSFGVAMVLEDFGLCCGLGDALCNLGSCNAKLAFSLRKRKKGP